MQFYLENLTIEQLKSLLPSIYEKVIKVQIKELRTKNLIKAIKLYRDC